MKRDRTGDLSVMRNSPMWVASDATRVLTCASTWSHVWEPYLDSYLCSSRGPLPPKASRHLCSGLIPRDMLMCDCYTELALPSPRHCGRAGPESMTAGELTPLLASYSTPAGGDMSMKSLALPLASRALVWIRKRYPLPPFPGGWVVATIQAGDKQCWFCRQAWGMQ